MTDRFFSDPILNSPYEYPGCHWELDSDGQPTNRIIEERRRAEFVTPIPKSKRQRRAKDSHQQDLLPGEARGLAHDKTRYETLSIINDLRHRVDAWRALEDPSGWRVTPETQRLLQHWRHHEFSTFRPFFCQLEAVETAIWLSEVAPQLGKDGEQFRDRLVAANDQANPGLNRLALKLATGAGKTTVMAMLIVWQTINAVRRPTSSRYSRGFLIVTPGITIKDRLRVLLPNDPDSYYQSRELVPGDMLPEVDKAKIVITNYHAFKRRETLDISKGGRALVQGRRGEPMQTIESEGQMLQRVIPELMNMSSIVVMNDEAHHCYREKPAEEAEGELADGLKGDEKDEAEKNSEAARVWISGLEAINRRLGSDKAPGIRRVFDLSATPFFLKGSGYAEGTLFPWVMSDFSLMDAIECGIVKLPRVPVADNVPGGDMPKLRKLWDEIGSEMPKKGRKRSSASDPHSIPTLLQTALSALYGHYEKTFHLWQDAGVAVPPCFIIVCNNTSSSKLVYDYISGFHRPHEDDSTIFEQGRLSLFRNYNDDGEPIPKPRTILVDSEQLESGDVMDDAFKKVCAAEIELFKQAEIERHGDRKRAENMSDTELLREVMNTVGKQGRLGADVRCVVSVSMLTEGWDANNVTHVLGVRAFGTQLICEQVIGRALRRQSYDLNESGRFNVEYADVLGIPFDFTAKPVPAPVQKPVETVPIHAVNPEREELEIRFPRLAGYRVELPDTRLEAEFTEDNTFDLTPEVVGPTRTRNEGIIGEGIDLNLVHTGELRRSTVVMNLTKRLLERKFRDEDGQLELALFGQLKRLVNRWLDTMLTCRGGTYEAQLMYLSIADRVCEKIHDGITRALMGNNAVCAVMDPFNPEGSSTHVRFNTSTANRWKTDPRKCHVNLVVCDSDWEAEFCRVAESHPRVLSYVKNHNLGFEVPYHAAGIARRYRPDFIVRVDDGHGSSDPLNLVVEVKGYRDEDAKAKKSAMETKWLPAVNRLGLYGRWAFHEFRDVWDIQDDFEALLENLGSAATQDESAE